ncbi:FliI/YscN family ATPase [Pandoraea pneumonica]|uniref:FliI/YscN family ATPase n=1 Tax=Pandoraea pneumonica TaxID=2508299 RepID=UPI003CF816E7
MRDHYLAGLSRATLISRTGKVTRVSGLAVEATGTGAGIGDVCEVLGDDGSRRPAEVVGANGERVTLMPYGVMSGMKVGDCVLPGGALAQVGFGPTLLGRVVDAFCRPLDGRGEIEGLLPRALSGGAINPMERPRIHAVFETGVRAIDTLLTLGQGQRVGIFAGSGVGKSSLLGMMARSVRSDVNVVALIGERGREVREFIEKHLGEEGLARTVVVVATSDQPALMRMRAARAAIAIAEGFRAMGKQVFLTMDSVTRYAMARREVGLAAGEPPTARGYTPSVFTEIPELCERCGTAPGGGAITAVFTVLVDGDDFNEPVADCLRATLDGHVVLSRELAHKGHFPAIDVLRSASRVMPDVIDETDAALARNCIEQIALLDQHRTMIDIGAYTAGANPAIDAAIALDEPLRDFLRQAQGGVARALALNELRQRLGGAS